MHSTEYNVIQHKNINVMNFFNLRPEYIWITSVYIIFLNCLIQAQWVQTNWPTDYPYVYCIEVKENNIYAGCNYGILHSSDNGTNWEKIGLSNSVVKSIAIIDSSIFAGTINGIYLSTNLGSNWSGIGLENKEIEEILIQDKYVYVGTYGSGVYKTLDNGQTWLQINNGLTNLNILSLAALDSNIYIGTSGSGLFLSTDYGENWISIGLINSHILDIAIYENTIYAGTFGDGIYKSDIGNYNWTSINNGFPNESIYTRVIRLNGNLIFSGNSFGVYYTPTSSISWTEFNLGLGTQDIYSLAITDSIIFAGVFEGVILRPLSDIITSVNEIYRSTNFSLQQNYPNPFNPSTTISYSIGMSGLVTLKVYDVLGREVSNLLEEVQMAGSYKLKFNSTNLPSGVYFYKLQSGDFSETKKLILLH